MSLPLDQIILGDCLEVMQTFPDKSIDLVLTDPVWPNALPSLIGSDDPYGLFAAAVKEITRLTDTLAVHLGCTSDPRFLRCVPKELSYFRTMWLRHVMPSKRGRVLIGSDVAYIFGRPPKSRPGNRLISGEITARHGNPQQYKAIGHPTPRQLEHVRGLVSKLSNEGDVVLDPFCGSGTTARACKDLNRHYIGIEIHPAFVKIAEERLRQEVLI
jgi:site-specific DNA-methyltransferase (adenine-specific)